MRFTCLVCGIISEKDTAYYQTRPQVSFKRYLTSYNLNTSSKLGSMLDIQHMVFFLDQELKVDSIDICQHRYTIPCAKKVEQLFEGRFRFGNKDSQTVQSGTLTGYDLVYIDGDHKFDSFRSDFQLCVDADIEWILIDDTNLFAPIRDFAEHADQPETPVQDPLTVSSR